MNEMQIGALILVVTLFVLFSGVPIAWGLTIVAVGFLLAFKGAASLANVPILMMDELSSFALLTIPLFILLGAAIGVSAAGKDIYESLHRWLDRVPGGLVIANILACGIFSAICGSSPATAAAIGKAGVPEMLRRGVPPALATGSICAGGTLGILIPPSLILVIYAIITEQSIGKLFLAAIVPGLIAVLGYAIAIAVYVRLKPDAGPAGSRVAWGERLRSLRHVWPVAAIFVLVIGGIYFGVFTPTEGAAIGAAATGLVAAVYRRLDWPALRACLIDTAQATAVIFLILIGADVYNAFLALSQLPAELADALGASGFAPMSILIGVLLIYLLLGCVMDSLAMILLTVPVFFPMITGLEFGLGEEATAIWFGILVLIVVEVGLITPPIGLNVYVINSLAGGVSLTESFKGIVPFLMSDFVRVAVILAVPATCLWLPGLMD